MYLSVCDKSSTLSVILMIKNAITIFKLLIPAILVIVSAYDLFHTVIDLRNKVYPKIIKRMIALVCIFFVPTILSLFLDLLGTSDIFSSSCWTNANPTTIAVLKNQEQVEADALEAAKKKENEKAAQERKKREEAREKIRKQNEKKAEEAKKKKEEEERKRRQQQGNNGSVTVDDPTFLHESGTDGQIDVINGIFYKPAGNKAGTAGTKGSAPYGYNKFFYNRLKAFTDAAKAAGHTVNMGTTEDVAWRPIERQQYFYNCYITQSCNNGNLAAVPGTGNHGWGLASDLSFGNYNDILWAHDNCSRFGLRFSVCNNIRSGDCTENWHIEPTTIKTK